MFSPKQKNKRSKLYVDPEVQKALGRRVAIHWIVFLVFCFGFVGLLQAFIEHPSTSVPEMFMYAVKRNIIPMVVGISLVPIFIFDTMQVTNRFAGPVYRMRELLRSIAAGGECRKMVIRSGDYWQGLADEFNAAMAALSGDVQTRQSTREEELEAVG